MSAPTLEQACEELEQQRDELLAALEMLVERHLIGDWSALAAAHFAPALSVASLAIFNVRGAFPEAPACVGELSKPAGAA